MATGHYARVESDDDRLAAEAQRRSDKDQSYFLFSLTQDQLAAAMFPVGSLTQAEVRASTPPGATVADKPDSQEICFVPDGDYASFIEKTRSLPRKRRRIVPRAASSSAPCRASTASRSASARGSASRGSRRYTCCGSTPTAGDVTVGPKSSARAHDADRVGVNWVAVDAPDHGWRVTAQIRCRHAPAPARVRAVDEQRAELEFEAPVGGYTGQAVVFYHDDVVVAVVGSTDAAPLSRCPTPIA